MAFGIFKILKGLKITQENTLTPREIEIQPSGSAGTKTTIVSAQTSNITVTLPNTNSVIATQAEVNASNTALNDHIIDTVDAHDASAISNSPSGNLSSTDVQAALNELQSDVDTRATDANLTSHSNATTGVHGVGAGSIVGTNLAQTLTNKNIDADQNTITNIENADIKAGAGIDATKIANGSVDNTEFQTLNGVTSGIQSQLDSKALATDLSTHISNTSAHGVTGNVVGTSSTQVLTNKDIDGGTASNTNRITLPKAAKTALDGLTRKQGTLWYDTTSNKPYYDDGTNLQLIGSGSGGTINFIANPDAEAGTTGWATYADAAATRPVDGTGGVANITWTTTATNPLNGSNSFLLTKDAVNRQGQGVSYDMSLPLEFRGKALSIEVPYIISSGTFTAGTSSTDSDLIIYAYDITNSKLVEPSSIKLLSNSTSIADVMKAQIQFDSNCTSARLIIHCATTSASAYTVEFDDIVVSPSQYVFGTPITDWQSYTATVTGLGSVTSATYEWSRHGDSIFIKGRFLSGTGTAVVAQITLPSGLTIDSTKVPALKTAGNLLVQTTANDYPVLITGGTNYITFGTGTTKLTNTNGNIISGGAVDMAFEAGPIPILGWSSSVQMSDSSDTRVVAATYKNDGVANAISANAAIRFRTLSGDTHGAYNTTTGRYTIPVSGWYQISTNIQITTANVGIYLAKNNTQLYAGWGSNGSNNWTFFTGSWSDYFVQGDLVDIRFNGAVTFAANTFSNFSISRMAGPNQIAASETVAASYYCSVNKSSSTTQPTDFDTKLFDTHGSVTTGASWKFTAPLSGIYEISLSQLYTVGNNGYVAVYKNGVAYANIGYFQSANGAFAEGTMGIQLVANDYIDLRTTTASTVKGNTLNSANDVAKIYIKRVGL